VRAADHRSVGGTPPYARWSRWSCYDGISVVTATSPGRLAYKNRAPSRPPRATPSHRPPLPLFLLARLLTRISGRLTTLTYSLEPLEACAVASLPDIECCRRSYHILRPLPPATAVRRRRCHSARTSSIPMP
jgi:hypothetical protein